MNRFITALAILLTAAIGTSAMAGESWAAEEISPAQVRERVAADPESLVIVDVRTVDEYEAGHVPGAIHIPHDEIAARLAELEESKDKPIVVYCRSGKRAAKALEILHEAGFKRLLHLTGDMAGWEPQTVAE